MPEHATVRRVRMSESDRVRSIRLEALRDEAAGVAFRETLADAEAKSTDFWQDRTIGAALSDDAAQFVAEIGRDWVGAVTVLIPEPAQAATLDRANIDGRASIVAVYVRPSHRGQGILETLVDAAGEWASDLGQTELTLDVHEHNSRARRAYTRLGFALTGHTWEGPNGVEREMARTL